MPKKTTSKKKVARKRTTIKQKMPKGIAPLDNAIERTPPGKGGTHPPALRLEAMAVYVMDLEGCTVRDLHKDPRFHHIQYSTLRSWCVEDGWDKLRQESVQKLRTKLSKELSFRLSENLLREIKDLMDMRDLVWKTIRDSNGELQVAPRSLEGMLKELREVNKRINEIAELSRQGILDDTGKRIPETSDGAKHHMDPAHVQELRTMAKMFTAKKRVELRAHMKPKTVDVEVDKEGE